jgi:hypothetical protein
LDNLNSNDREERYSDVPGEVASSLGLVSHSTKSDDEDTIWDGISSLSGSSYAQTSKARKAYTSIKQSSAFFEQNKLTVVSVVISMDSDPHATQSSALFFGNPAVMNIIESNNIDVQEAIDHFTALLKYVDIASQLLIANGYAEQSTNTTGASRMLVSNWYPPPRAIPT